MPEADEAHWERLEEAAGAGRMETLPFALEDFSLPPGAVLDALTARATPSSPLIELPSLGLGTDEGPDGEPLPEKLKRGGQGRPPCGGGHEDPRLGTGFSRHRDSPPSLGLEKWGHHQRLHIQLSAQKNIP